MALCSYADWLWWFSELCQSVHLPAPDYCVVHKYKGVVGSRPPDYKEFPKDINHRTDIHGLLGCFSADIGRNTVKLVHCYVGFMCSRWVQQHAQLLRLLGSETCLILLTEAPQCNQMQDQYIHEFPGLEFSLLLEWGDSIALTLIVLSDIMAGLLNQLIILKYVLCS